MFNETDELKDLHVVLIEDQKEVLELEKRILENAGATVHAYDNAKLAYAYLDNPSVQIDTIVTDIVIGNINGIDYLNKRINDQTWIPSVVVSGSHASSQMIELFDQGFVANNGIPFVLLPKKPAGFKEKLINRVKYVVEIGDSLDYEKLEGGVRTFKLAAQDEGVYGICSKIVDKYFAIAAKAVIDFESLKYPNPEYAQRAEKLIKFLDESKARYSDFLGLPAFAAHKVAADLQRIMLDLGYLSSLGQNLKDEMAEWIPQRVEDKFIEFGNYLSGIRRNENIQKVRDKTEETEILHGQVSAAALRQVLDGKKAPSRLDQFEGFTPSVESEGRILRELIASDRIGYSNFIKGFDVSEDVGTLIQAINAIALNATIGRKYDAVLVHPHLPENSIYCWRDEITEIVEDSLYSHELTDTASAFLNQYLPNVGEKYPNFDEMYHGEKLIAIMRTVFPEAKIIGTGGWIYPEEWHTEGNIPFEDYDFIYVWPNPEKDNMDSIFLGWFPELKQKHFVYEDLE